MNKIKPIPLTKDILRDLHFDEDKNGNFTYGNLIKGKFNSHGLFQTKTTDIPLLYGLFVEMLSAAEGRGLRKLEKENNELKKKIEKLKNEFEECMLPSTPRNGWS